MAVGDTRLLEWERAEIARSAVQASSMAAFKPRPTTPTVAARYANPPADTWYALEYAFHLLGDVRGQHVLDLGCGSGEFTALVARRGAKITALDISADLLGMTRARANGDGYPEAVRPVCASAHAIPLPTGSVDVVFGMAVLHHLDLALAADEVHRVLKPGGRAIFKEPMRNSRLVAGVRKLIPYRHPNISPFERPLRFDEIESVASRFRTWNWRAFDLPFVSAARLAGLPKTWQQRASARDAALLRKSPLLQRYASVVVFEVRK